MPATVAPSKTLIREGEIAESRRATPLEGQLDGHRQSGLTGVTTTCSMTVPFDDCNKCGPDWTGVCAGAWWRDYTGVWDGYSRPAFARYRTAYGTHGGRDTGRPARSFCTPLLPVRHCLGCRRARRSTSGQIILYPVDAKMETKIGIRKQKIIFDRQRRKGKVGSVKRRRVDWNT